MRPSALIVAACLGLACQAPAAEPPAPAAASAATAGVRLLDPADPALLAGIRAAGQPDAALRVVEDGGAKAVEFTCATGQPYPGIELRPAAGAWDLSAYSGIEMTVVNAGPAEVMVSLRIDEAGGDGNAWNGEGKRLAPGASGTVRVRFGQSWGKPGYQLDAKRIGRVLIHTGTVDEPAVLRLRSLAPCGKAGDKPGAPQAINTRRPASDPLVLSFAAPPPPERLTLSGLTQRIADRACVLTVAAAAERAEAVYRPLRKPDLRDFDQAVFILRNPGAAPLRVVCRLDGVQSDRVQIEAELAPGERREVVLPFASATPWHGISPAASDGNGDKPFTGAPVEASSNGLVNDAIAAVTVVILAPTAGTSLVWEGVTAGVSPPFTPPAWLGTRPPVDGDWVQTLAEEFDGAQLDPTRWTPRLPWIGPIPWELQRYNDKNVLLADGHLIIRCEKKTGHLYDNPAWPSRDYTTGAVTTYPHWRWRYGYAEARMRRPTALGLWPAFWTMPDRGPLKADGSEMHKNERRNTGDDGMELDIMEHCTRFGPFRHNVAAHWDGYGKDHKSLGTSRIYARADQDGWIVAGLLWEPGRLAWYSNGTLVGEWSDQRVATVPASLKFTVQMGGWAGNEVDDAALPQDFRIDWVRVWQLRERLPKGE